MKLHSPLPHKKTRIEIIPLIDIMFFLLACFMLVSLNMIQLHGLNVNLPVASSASASPDESKKPTTITVEKSGNLLIEKDSVPREALAARLEQLKKEKGDDLRIYIAGDKEASHGDVVSVLDQVRREGISKVAIQIKAGSATTPPAAHVPAHVPVATGGPGASGAASAPVPAPAGADSAAAPTPAPAPVAAAPAPSPAAALAPAPASSTAPTTSPSAPASPSPSSSP